MPFDPTPFLESLRGATPQMLLGLALVALLVIAGGTLWFGVKVVSLLGNHLAHKLDRISGELYALREEQRRQVDDQGRYTRGQVVLLRDIKKLLETMSRERV